MKVLLAALALLYINVFFVETLANLSPFDGTISEEQFPKYEESEIDVARSLRQYRGRLETFRDEVLEGHNEAIMKYRETLVAEDKKLEQDRKEGKINNIRYWELHKHISKELENSSEDGEYMKPYYMYINKYKEEDAWTNRKLKLFERVSDETILEKQFPKYEESEIDVADSLSQYREQLETFRGEVLESYNKEIMKAIINYRETLAEEDKKFEQDKEEGKISNARYWESHKHISKELENFSEDGRYMKLYYENLGKYEEKAKWANQELKLLDLKLHELKFDETISEEQFPEYEESKTNVEGGFRRYRGRLETFRDEDLEGYNKEIMKYRETLVAEDKKLEQDRKEGKISNARYWGLHKHISKELENSSEDGEYMKPYYMYINRYKKEDAWANLELKLPELMFGAIISEDQFPKYQPPENEKSELGKLEQYINDLENFRKYDLAHYRGAITDYGETLEEEKKTLEQDRKEGKTSGIFYQELLKHINKELGNSSEDGEYMKIYNMYNGKALQQEDWARTQHTRIKRKGYQL